MANFRDLDTGSLNKNVLLKDKHLTLANVLSVDNVSTEILNLLLKIPKMFFVVILRL